VERGFPFEELDQHHAKRHFGLPVVTVLLGPPVLARRHFFKWAQGRGHQVAQVVTPTHETLMAAWLNACFPGMDLVSTALEQLGHKTCLQKAEAEGKLVDLTPHLRRSFLENAFGNRLESAAECLCFNILLDNLKLSDPADLIENSKSWFGHHLDHYQKLIAALLSLDSRPIPAVWFQMPQTDSMEQLALAAEMLGEFTLQFPEICVAWGIDTESFQTYASHGRDSRGKSICRNTILVPVVEMTDTIGIADHEYKASLEYVVRTGATPDQVQELQSLSDSLREARDHTDQEVARSKAESFLYDRLESIPETVGLFKLNDRLEIPFHQGTMEVDLVNHRHRIAVEVDGYYHFSDPEAYKRDRRKDYLLQKHGFFVIRCLATDVVCNLEEIFCRITEVIRMRRESVTEDSI